MLIFVGFSHQSPWSLCHFIHLFVFFFKICCICSFFPAVPEIPEMNLVFAISATGVDESTNFEKMKQVIRRIVQKFGSNRIHYGVITFGDPFKTELPLNRQPPTDEDLERFISKKTECNELMFRFPWTSSESFIASRACFPNLARARVFCSLFVSRRNVET